MAGSACGDVSGKRRTCQIPGMRACESNQPGVFAQDFAAAPRQVSRVERQRWRMLPEINVALLTLSPSLSKCVAGRKTQL